MCGGWGCGYASIPQPSGGVELQHANDVVQRRAGGSAKLLDVVDDVLGLDLRPRAEPGLPRIVQRGDQAVAVDRHLRRHEQEVAGPHGLRLVTKCGRNAGIDVALLRGAAGLPRGSYS